METPPLREVTPLLANQFDLRTNMRLLWTEHVVWMRNYVIDDLAGLPETSLTLQHLLGSQAHIGDELKTFYGKAPADQLTALLNSHVADAASTVAAIKTGDPAAIDSAKVVWYSNADQIAALLSRLNPNWSFADLQSHTRADVDFTLGQINARVGQDWARDVVVFDLTEAHSLSFADFLSSGLITQFRPQISGSLLSARDEALSLTMRKLWEERAIWTRFDVVSRTAKLPDASFAEERLLKNQTDIGNAFKPFYGDAAGDELARLLRDQVAKGNTLFAAMESSDQNAIATAKTAWYQSGDAVAQYLASLNPHWAVADLQSRMRHQLDLTMQEVSARIAQNWQWDLVFYEAAVVDVLSFADTLASGIAQQFPQVPLSTNPGPR